MIGSDVAKYRGVRGSELALLGIHNNDTVRKKPGQPPKRNQKAVKAMQEFQDVSFGGYLVQKAKEGMIDEPIAALIKLIFEDSKLLKHGKEWLMYFEKHPCKSEKDYLEKLAQKAMELMKNPEVGALTEA